MAVAAGTSQMALASSQSESEGFVEGSSLTILNRNLYMNRDARDNGFGGTPAANGQSYREAWGHGFIGTFESGFTQGTVGVGVGVGVDAFAMIGLKLDTGDGRNGGRSSFDVLPVKGDGEARDEYTKVGGAAKEIARAAAKAVSWASFIVDSSFK